MRSPHSERTPSFSFKKVPETGRPQEFYPPLSGDETRPLAPRKCGICFRQARAGVQPHPFPPGHVQDIQTPGTNSELKTCPDSTVDPSLQRAETPNSEG